MPLDIARNNRWMGGMSQPIPSYPGEREAESPHRGILRNGEPIPLELRIGEPGPGIRVSDDLWTACSPGAGFLEVCEGATRVAPLAFVSPDRLKAKLDLRQPANDEGPLIREEVDLAVAALGITHGINSGRIDAAWRVFDSRGVLMRSLRFALGTAPVLGKASTVEYEARFQRQERAIDPAEEIDYRDQGGVLSVDEGERIGIYQCGAMAMPGMGVDGVAINVPASDPPAPLEIGDNVLTSKQSNGDVILTSAVGGALTFTGGAPHVSEVMTISGDVDYESGNIDVGGSLLIRGSVRAGFKVSACHCITVLGVAEGADLAAGGDMVLAKGLIGSEGTRVTVGGNLRVKYTQNADIICGGDVEILDADMGSKVVASGRIIAVQGRGRLRGGTYSAGSSISAKEIGSELGAITKLSCGVDEVAAAERKQTADLLNEISAGLQELKGLTDPSNSVAQRKADTKILQLENSQLALMARMKELKAAAEAAAEGEQPFVRAKSQVYFGTQIEVLRVKLSPSKSTAGRRFTLDKEQGCIVVE